MKERLKSCKKNWRKEDEEEVFDRLKKSRERGKEGRISRELRLKDQEKGKRLGWLVNMMMWWLKSK